MITIQSIPCVCTCITRVFARVFLLFYSFLDRVHLQETPSQDFINQSLINLLFIYLFILFLLLNIYIAKILCIICT